MADYETINMKPFAPVALAALLPVQDGVLILDGVAGWAALVLAKSFAKEASLELGLRRYESLRRERTRPMFSSAPF